LKRYWVLIVILLAAVLFSPDPGTSRAIAAAHDFAHAPIFGCVAVFLLISLRRMTFARQWSVGRQYAAAIAAAAGLGLATEILQALGHRDASWLDLRSDVLGAIAFGAMFTVVDGRLGSVTLCRIACAVGAVLMLVHSAPFAKTVLAYVRRNEAFPVVFEAGDNTPDAFVGALRSRLAYEPLPAEFASYANEQALHIQFGSGEWLGMAVDEPYPDWTGYGALALDMTNSSDQVLAMAIRVHDRAHDHRFEDRFNRSFNLAPRTRTTLVIPLAEIERGPVARKLDLQQVAQLVLFTSGENESRDLYVSRIWLR
jgi:hypothetical protein